MENQKHSSSGLYTRNIMISIIACISRNNALGYHNRLLYHIREDMDRFKTLTMRHTVVMGRKTWESLPVKPLPGRKNIVLSHRLPTVLPEDDLFIIGGASVYQQFIDKAHRLYMTVVDDIPNHADAFFPSIDPRVWHIKKDEFHPADETHPYSFHFIDYER